MNNVQPVADWILQPPSVQYQVSKPDRLCIDSRRLGRSGFCFALLIPGPDGVGDFAFFFRLRLVFNVNTATSLSASITVPE
jgi:hypothetical protein